MKSFRVIYERKTTNSYWNYATEIIEARGLMHVQKLATDHLKEMKKFDSLPMRIKRITEITDDAD